MKLPSEIFGEVIVVHAPEELGEDQAASFIAHMANVERPKVILDLNGTESIDSHGLEALVDVQDALREHGGDLKLCTSNLVNRKILEITRLDRNLDVYENVIDAVKSFNA